MAKHINLESWKELKNEVVRNWKKINEDELEQTKGDVDKVVSLVKSKYEETSRSVRDQLNKLIKNVKTEDKKEHPHLRK